MSALSRKSLIAISAIILVGLLVIAALVVFLYMAKNTSGENRERDIMLADAARWAGPELKTIAYSDMLGTESSELAFYAPLDESHPLYQRATKAGGSRQIVDAFFISQRAQKGSTLVLAIRPDIILASGDTLLPVNRQQDGAFRVELDTSSTRQPVVIAELLNASGDVVSDALYLAWKPKAQRFVLDMP